MGRIHLSRMWDEFAKHQVGLDVRQHSVRESDVQLRRRHGGRVGYR